MLFVFAFKCCTPLKHKRLEPKNPPIEKEHHLPNLQFGGSKSPIFVAFSRTMSSTLARRIFPNVHTWALWPPPVWRCPWGSLDDTTHLQPEKTQRQTCPKYTEFHRLPTSTLQGTNISPQKWDFEDDFPFPKVGYVNSLEGIFYVYTLEAKKILKYQHLGKSHMFWRHVGWLPRICSYIRRYPWISHHDLDSDCWTYHEWL